MKIATWNINGVKARARGRHRPGSRRRARRRLPAGDQDAWTKAFPTAALRGPRLQRRRPRPEGLQRRRHPLEAAVRGRGGARPARRRRATSTPRYIEAVSPRRAASCASASIYLPNGNPIGTDKFAYKLAWMERLEPTRATCSRSRSRPAARRLQRHPRADRCQEPAGLGRATRCSSPRRAPPSARSQPRPHRRACAPAIPGPASTRSGTTRPAPGRRTTASASTTCCCRRRPPTVCAAPASTSFTRGWEKPSDHVPVWVELDFDVSCAVERVLA